MADKLSLLTPCVIIHKRDMIDNNVVNPKAPDHICVECTLLEPGGKEHIWITLALFKVRDVAVYLI